MTPVCASCRAPLGDDAVLCSRCMDFFLIDLGDVTAISDELDVTLSRQKGQVYRDGGKSSGRPLPYSTAASDVLGRLRGVLVADVRMVVQDRAHQQCGPECPPNEFCIRVRETDWPASTLPAMANLLMLHGEWLRHHDQVDRIADEIHDVLKDARRIIDLNEDRTTFPVGPCPETLDDHPCVGEIRAYFPLDPATEARMECTKCQKVYIPKEWNRAGERILKAREGRAS